MQKGSTVIGIDCGTAIVGWAILRDLGNKFEHISSGAIQTSKNDVMYLRLSQIYSELTKILLKFNPGSVAVEDIFYFKNQKTVISVSQARGVILLAGAQQNLSVYDYTPLQVKAAVTGYGRAEKKQVQYMVSKLLNLKEIPKLDDVTDAMAVAVCHILSRNLKARLR